MMLWISYLNYLKKFNIDEINKTIEFELKKFTTNENTKITRPIICEELLSDYFDLYKDGLPITYPGFANPHYYSGEAMLTFVPINASNNKSYFDWLEKNEPKVYEKMNFDDRVLEYLIKLAEKELKEMGRWTIG